MLDPLASTRAEAMEFLQSVRSTWIKHRRITEFQIVCKNVTELNEAIRELGEGGINKTIEKLQQQVEYALLLKEEGALSKNRTLYNDRLIVWLLGTIKTLRRSIH